MKRYLFGRFGGFRTSSGQKNEDFRIKSVQFDTIWDFFGFFSGDSSCYNPWRLSVQVHSDGLGNSLKLPFEAERIADLKSTCLTQKIYVFFVVELVKKP